MNPRVVLREPIELLHQLGKRCALFALKQGNRLFANCIALGWARGFRLLGEGEHAGPRKQRRFRSTLLVLQ